MSGRPIPSREKRTRADWARINAINAEGRKRKAAGLSYFKKGRIEDKRARPGGEGTSGHAERVADTRGFHQSIISSDIEEEGDPNFPPLPTIAWADGDESGIESPIAHRTRSQTLPTHDSEEEVQSFINRLAAGDEPGPGELSPVEDINIFEATTDEDGDTIMAAVQEPEEPSAAYTAGNVGGNAPGSASKAAGAEGSGLVLFKSVSMIEQGDIVFTHKFHFQTWGHQWLWIDGKATANATANGVRRLVTSACQLYTNHVTQFMSPAEFASLPPFATAKKVSLRVTPLAIESSFETGTTLSASASIQHAPIFIYNHGGNLAYPMESVGVTRDAGTMKITGINSVTSDTWKKLLWGDADMTEYPAVTGLQRNWPIYDSWVTPLKAGASNPWSLSDASYGCPQMDKIYTSGLAADIVNAKKCITWSYQPQIGILKTPKRIHGMFPSDGLYLQGSHGYPLTRLGKNDTTTATLKSSNNTLIPLSRDNANVILGRDIEKGWSYTKLNDTHSAPQIPSCSFGIMPVPNNAPNSENSWVNCKLLFALETYIKIKVDYESYNTFIQTFSNNGELWHDGTFFDNFNPVTFDSNTTFSTGLAPSSVSSSKSSAQTLLEQNTQDVEMITPVNVPLPSKPTVPVIPAPAPKPKQPSIETLCKQPGNKNHTTCKELAKKKKRTKGNLEMEEEYVSEDDER